MVRSNATGHVVQTAQGEGDLANVGVAGAFAHAVDGSLNPGGSAADGGDGASGGHAEVVVSVEMHRDTWSDPAAYFANQKFDGFGAARSDGVYDYDFGGAGFECGQINFLEEFEIGAGAVDGEERYRDSVLFGEGHGVGYAAQHVFAG